VVARRQYSSFGSVDTAQPHTISFDYRPQVSLPTSGGTNYSDIDNRYQVFGSTSEDTGTGVNNTWVAIAAPGGTAAGSPQGVVAGNWGFLSGSTSSTGFNNQTFVDSEIPMSPGTVYHFEITVYPATKSYVGHISDGTNTFTSGSLLFRNQGTAPVVGDYLHFGRRQQGQNTNPSSQPLGFSLDSVLIVAVPEPAGLLLMLIGIGGVHAIQRRTRKIRVMT
jgi:hypothetical protein